MRNRFIINWFFPQNLRSVFVVVFLEVDSKEISWSLKKKEILLTFIFLKKRKCVIFFVTRHTIPHSLFFFFNFFIKIINFICKIIFPTLVRISSVTVSLVRRHELIIPVHHLYVIHVLKKLKNSCIFLFFHSLFFLYMWLWKMSLQN